MTLTFIRKAILLRTVPVPIMGASSEGRDTGEGKGMGTREEGTGQSEYGVWRWCGEAGSVGLCHCRRQTGGKEPVELGAYGVWRSVVPRDQCMSCA